jgi:hypothetical protein
MVLSASSFDTSLFNAAANPQTPIDPNVISGVISGTNPSGLSSQAISAIMGFGSDIASNTAAATTDNAKATQDNLEQQGYAIQQQGYQAETDAYTQAQMLSLKNANLAQLSGQVQQVANTRQINQSLGAQKAAVAGSGFGDAGSAAFIYADTMRQGAFGNQLIGTQANLNAAGYQQQAAASGAEIASTNTATQYAAIAQQKAAAAASVDTAAAQTESQAGVAATTNLQNAIAALTNNGTTTTGASGTSGPVRRRGCHNHYARREQAFL